MNPVQKKLLALGQTHNLSELGLREIARMVGVKHPQTVKYHLQKLGLLTKDASTPTSSAARKSDLISIPVFGLANCGPAMFFATPAPPEQYLQVSKNILGSRAGDDLYAVRAVGDSLNRANINGKNVETGDYIIVDPDDKDFKSGDYVLSLINDLANIKKFFKDENDKQVVLLSESTEEYPPIYIHTRDFDHYIASAKVVDVLKQPPTEKDPGEPVFTFEKLPRDF